MLSRSVLHIRTEYTCVGGRGEHCSRREVLRKRLKGAY
jgi:hypothetical protein